MKKKCPLYPLLAILIVLAGLVPAARPAQAGPAAWGISLTPLKFHFGLAEIGQSSPAHAFVVVNTTGIYEIDMASALILSNRGGPAMPPPDPNFTVTQDGCAGVWLPPGGSCTIQVAFTPKSPAGKTAFLYVSGSIPDGPMVCEFAELSGLGPVDEVTYKTEGVVGELDDPVSTSVGEYYFDKPLLDLGGPMDLRFTLTYASWMRTGKVGQHNDPFQGDWDHNYHLALAISSPDDVAFQYGPGDRIHFHKEGGAWQVVGERTIYRLQEDDVGAGYFYLLNPLTGLVYTFEKDLAHGVGLLVRIEDRNGNALAFTNDEDGRILLIDDGLGRSLSFTYTVPTWPWIAPQLAEVRDQAGRTLRFGYESAGGNLVAITDAMGLVTTYAYTGTITDSVIMAQTLPRGNVPTVQTYARAPGGTAWRVTAQTDAYGNVTTLDYDDALGQTTITDPLGQVYRHTHKNGQALTDWTDQADNTVAVDYDAQDRPLTMTDRLGDITQYTYHPETGRIASITDAAGHTFTYLYTPQQQTFINPANGSSFTFTFYDLTRIVYPDGSAVEMACDAHGNITQVTNRAGSSWTITPNSRGQPLTITEPTGGVTTYTYNPDGTLASSADSESGTTTYLYDAYKRQRRIVHPDGTFIQMTYDLADRLLSVTHERGGAYTLTYDENGKLRTLRDPLGRTITYTRDLLDRLAEHVDALGQRSAYTYDALGRLAAFTDPHNYTRHYVYDARGWLTGFVDPAGYTWTTAYDDEGIPVADTTPLGHATTYESDELGHIVRITDPLGRSMRLSYDERGQVTVWTDRIGRTTLYDYDEGGYLTQITSPLVGSVTYQHDDRGLPTRITDLRGNHWDFGYSPMGRLTSQRDPLNNTWTYHYDDRGRPERTTFPDGGTADYTYDAQSNVTQVAFSGGPTLNYGYDVMGRLVTADHVALTYDARGDIVDSRDGTASFGATYDAGRWLQTVSYDGHAVVTYTYDARGLLVRVEDDLAGAWMDLFYNADGELIDVRRSNGISTTFTYDDAGALVRIQDGALADQRYTLDAEGQVLRLERTVPLDPAPTSKEARLTYDAANQISSAGYSYDARGRQTAAPAGKLYTWDGASALTQVVSGTATVALTYNGLGDLRTRTVDGVTTTYYHNYALGLSPIVAEEVGGAYKRFYVYAPGGALLYAIDAAGGEACFYHFDRLGSTLFLTNDGGGVSDAYAYDPYGNLLGHEGDSDQPFTFVGRYGVRWEPVGRLYHMRVRYYDPGTAQFLSRDPEWPDILEPEELNPYIYTNDPLQDIDPLGRCKISLGAIMKAGTKIKGLLAKLKAAGGIGKNMAQGTATTQPQGGGQWHPAEAALIGLLSQVPGSTEMLETLDKVFTDEPITQDDAGNIVSGITRNILETVPAVTRFVAETIMDAAWVASERNANDKATFWKLYFSYLRESNLLQEIIGICKAMEEIAAWLGKEAGNIYNKTLLAAEWTGHEAGNNLGTMIYGTQDEQTKQVAQNMHSHNPVISAGYDLGSWFGNWLFGVK